jgi:hypothetical protein
MSKRHVGFCQALASEFDVMAQKLHRAAVLLPLNPYCLDDTLAKLAKRLLHGWYELPAFPVKWHLQ